MLQEGAESGQGIQVVQMTEDQAQLVSSAQQTGAAVQKPGIVVTANTAVRALLCFLVIVLIYTS